MRIVAVLLLLMPALGGCVYALETGLDELFVDAGTYTVQPNWSGAPIVLDVELEQPLFQGDWQRTGWYPSVTTPTRVEPAWTIAPWNLGEHSAAKGSAVVANGIIYAGTDHGWLMAVHPDGHILWNTTIGGPPRGTHGTPLVHAGVVYIGNYDGYLTAVDADDGQRLWSTKLGGSVASSPLWYQGHIVVATETSIPSGILHVVDANGTVVWKDATIGDHPHSSVAIDAGRSIAVVGANDGLLYAWNVRDITAPTRLWEFETGRAIKGPIMVADGAAFFGSWDTNIYRVDLETGTEDWSFSTSNFVMGGAALHADAGLVFIGGHDKRMHALDARTGDEVWHYRTEGRIIGQPTVTSNAVVFGSFDRHLYALDVWTGERLWSHAVAGPVSSAPLVRDDLIVFADRSIDAPGGLYALRSAP